jgi:hypothetical protein
VTTATVLTFTILSGLVMNKLIEAPALALRERVMRRKPACDPIGALRGLPTATEGQPEALS